tara:strand:- start:787 stop:1362 length:576 start_codon:yes stop_codon:yes gene_type:complete
MLVTEAHLQSANIKRFTTLQHSKAAFTKANEWISADVNLDTKLNAAREHHYFSVTGRMRDSCGCLHNQILEVFPQLQPLVNAHLACIYTGEPLHSIANGHYHLFGPERKDKFRTYAASSFGCTEVELNDIMLMLMDVSENTREMLRTIPASVWQYKGLEDEHIPALEEYLAPKWLASRDAALACYEEWLNS